MAIFPERRESAFEYVLYRKRSNCSGLLYCTLYTFCPLIVCNHEPTRCDKYIRNIFLKASKSKREQVVTPCRYCVLLAGQETCSDIALSITFLILGKTTFEKEKKM